MSEGDGKVYVWLAYQNNSQMGYSPADRLVGVYFTRSEAEEAHPRGWGHYYVKTEVRGAPSRAGSHG